MVGSCTNTYRSLKHFVTIDNFLGIICIGYTGHSVSGMIDLEHAVIHTLGISIIVVIIVLLIMRISFFMLANKVLEISFQQH